MPLVRIDLIKGKPAAFRKQAGEIVYNAMRETINVPVDDKFQIITEHAARRDQRVRRLSRQQLYIRHHPDPGHDNAPAARSR